MYCHVFMAHNVYSMARRGAVQPVKARHNERVFDSWATQHDLLGFLLELLVACTRLLVRSIES